MVRWLVVVAVACGGSKPAVAPTPPGPGDFPDNPQLVHVPADTPYAFATFKPLARDVWDRLREMPNRAQQQPNPILRALAEELGDSSPERLASIGFDPKGRWLVYGLGAYPVIRTEIADREKLQAAMQRIVARAGITLSAPVERAGMRYWRFDLETFAVAIAVGRTDLAIAFVSRERLPELLPQILGEKRPARALTTAWFRDLARAKGFTGQGLGFVDVQRAEALALGVAPALAPACRATVDELARAVPRLVFGYDDISRHHISFSLIIELAPELLAAGRALVTKLPGLARLAQLRPLIGLAAAADLDRARSYAPRVASRVRELGERCGADLEKTAAAIDELGTRSLPPMVAGIRGVILALTELKRVDDKKRIEGFALVHVDDSSRLLGFAAAIPGFEAPAPDGRPTALPEQLEMPGHVGARTDAVAIAVGARSDQTVTELLAEPAAPAPLMLLVMDLPRCFGALRSFTDKPDPDAEAMAALLGRLAVQVDIDERGLVGSFSMELR